MNGQYTCKDVHFTRTRDIKIKSITVTTITTKSLFLSVRIQNF